jgi:hypothetical protein
MGISPELVPLDAALAASRRTDPSAVMITEGCSVPAER